MINRFQHFPPWLRRKLPKGSQLVKTGKALGGLPTVCEEASCPNLFECWSKKTATFLILGKSCTRACGFCDIDFAKKPPCPDLEEPQKVAKSVKELGLKHVVITMVARDDLPDGGAAHLIQVMQSVKEIPGTTIEVLTSDFAGNWEALDQVLAEKPNVYNHNVETVRRLTPRVRHKATYDRSLELLTRAKAPHLKSGLMVGLGETPDEVKETFHDLKSVGCDIVTVGQYLQPSRRKLQVKAFITPEEFKTYEEYGHSIGISNMYCGPFVRSSYNADLFV